MRQCGDCQLCCKLLPVRSLGKPAGERCQHQSFAKGCSVYAQLHRISPECQLWNCRWLANDDMADQSRPDRSHLVVDLMPDFITLHDGDREMKLQVIQVWCDPRFPDAHRDPKFREYLERRGQEGIAALIRYNAKEGFVLFPPSITPNGEWFESLGKSAGRDHTPEELEEFYAGAEVRIVP